MKYLILKNINPDYSLKTPSFIKQGSKLKINDKHLVVHLFNNEGNEAGFGWVWLFNSTTKNYEHKMSIFDGRVINGSVEVPYVGLTNNIAYEVLHARLAGECGFQLSFRNLLNWFKGLFNAKSS